MQIIKKMILGSFLVFFLSGCASTKYIPSRYFVEKHAMEVNVNNFPRPSHQEDENIDGGILGSMIGAAVKGSREKELVEVFSKIDTNAAKESLENQLKDRIKKYYKPEVNTNDLLVQIKIINWGWILPTASYGIRIGSYQMVLDGEVRVYDVSRAKEEIAHTAIQIQETIDNRMNIDENKKALARATEQFAEMAAEFLWRSDQDQK